jgi:integrase
MKTTTFELRGNTNFKTIQCRVTNGRNNIVRASTGLKIDTDNWIVEKQLTKGSNALEKNINSKLRRISDLVENDLSTNIVTTEWLKNIIDIVNGKIKADEKLLFLRACSEYIEQKTNLAKNTLELYNRAFTLLTDFIGSSRPQIKEVNKSFMLSFEHYLTVTKKLSKNSAIQHTRFIITVLNDCSKERGLEVAISRGYNEKPIKRDRREIVKLDRNELQLIKDLKDLPQHLENSRKWLLIGCEVGQRANDLLNITPSNISGGRLRLTQQKTKKPVVIPLNTETLEILKEFPKQCDIITLNRNIKTLCQLAELNTPVLKRVKENGIEFLKEVPKYEAISTHTMRRSYASNHYNIIPTSLIMSITKHATETQLIKYIGLTDEDIADVYEKETIAAKKRELIGN